MLRSRLVMSSVVGGVGSGHSGGAHHTVVRGGCRRSHMRRHVGRHVGRTAGRRRIGRHASSFA